MPIRLRRHVDADLALTLELETDPVAMAELGGPRDHEPLVRVHGTRVAEKYCMVVEEDGDALGTVFVWRTEHDGEPIHETGWMVLPRAHGRGVASAGLGLMLDLLREDPEVSALHAFPGVTNVPSNRLCDRFGFADRGEVDVDFGGAHLRCRHRVLELSADHGPS